MSAFKRNRWHKALAVGAVLLLGGCGLGGGPDGDVAVTGEVKGTIRFQTMQLSPNFDDYLHKVIDEFEKAHPGTTVEWTDIPSDAAPRKTSADAVAGTLPDVLDLDTATLAPLGRKGLVLDMAGAAGDVRDSYVATAWGSFEFAATKVAALPWYLNTPVLISNKALLRKAGLAGSPDPASYSELLDRSGKLATAAHLAGFQPTEIGFPNYLLTLGVPLVNEDSSNAVVNTPEAAAFVGKLAELYKSGGIPADTVSAKQRSEIETFSQGKTAYLESGGSRLKIIGENSPGILSSLSVGKPLGDAAKRTWVVAHGLAVPKSSGNAATALAFAKFMTSAQQQLALAQQSSVFPSTVASLADPFFATSGADLTTEARAIAATSLRDGRTVVKPAAVDAEYAEALWSAVQPAILGKVAPEQALRTAESKLTKILEDRRK